MESEWSYLIKDNIKFICHFQWFNICHHKAHLGKSELFPKVILLRYI